MDLCGLYVPSIYTSASDFSPTYHTDSGRPIKLEFSSSSVSIQISYLISGPHIPHFWLSSVLFP